MAARAYLYLTITAAGWGGNAVAGKLAVGHISPAMLTSLRWVVAVLILLPFAWPHLRHDWPIIRANAWRLFFLGLLGFALFNNFLYLGLNYTSAINGVILQAATPLVIFIASFVLLRQRTLFAQLMGFGLSVVGVVLVATDGQPARLLDLDIGLGDALLLMAVLCYGLYTVALRWKPQLHWLSLMTMLAIAAMIGSLPFTLWESAAGRMIVPDAQGWLIVLYAATIASIVTQVLYIRGNEMIGGNRAGLFFNLVPIFGTIFAVVILGEQLQAYHLIALVLVLGGIALAERRGRRQAAAGGA